MGLVYENITLKNSGDVRDARRGIIGELDVHQVDVQVIVDTGTEPLVFSEEIRQKLGLDILRKKRVALADGVPKTCLITEPVEIYWKDRNTVVHGLVMEGITEILLGTIPLEGMNLIVDPLNQRLVGAHGDIEIYRV
ncbi:MAG: hypothetical protein FWD24_07660 [Treponema sp.]|nr:hypothetical protein [Treponema sp.]